MTKINKHIKAMMAYVDSIPLGEINDVSAHLVQERIYQRQAEWRKSPEYKKYLINLQNEYDRRRAEEQAKSITRKKWAKENVKPGMLIKVQGTKDGKGLREVMSVTETRVICRQWSVHGFQGNGNDELQWDEKIWAVPCNRITEHEWNKVLGVFGMSNAMTYTGYKTVSQLSEGK